MWPQIIYFVLLIVTLTATLCKHGQPQDNYNFYTTFFGCVLMFGLLWWGGFFDPMFRIFFSK